MEPIHNDHNVYILGAGFSAGGGLPTMLDFLTRMRDAHPWLVNEKRNREAESIDKVLAFRLRAQSAGYWTSIDLENLEELFSLASAEGTGLVDDMTVAVAATLDFCRINAERTHVGISASGTTDDKLVTLFPWIRKSKGVFDQDTLSVPSYSYYVANLLGMFNENGRPKGENTFITFNYDTLVEDGLFDVKVPFNYGIKTTNAKLFKGAKAVHDENAIKILKLHGSVNWQFRKLTADSVDRELNILPDYRETLRQSEPPQLIPPTWRKNFNGAMEDVWTEAIKSLKTATRIVVIGFSMPPNDVHFRYLISAGLKDNISMRQIFFVDPGDNIKQRASAIFRTEHVACNKVVFIQQRLENYLSSQTNPVNIGRPRLGSGRLFNTY